jgi:ABC-type transport system involved in cytochrome c biogenesis permease component
MEFMTTRKIVWKRTLMVGFAILVIGLVFMVLAFSVGSDMLLLAFYGMGMLTIGFGLATLIFALTIKQLQKLEEAPPPPPPPV